MDRRRSPGICSRVVASAGLAAKILWGTGATLGRTGAVPGRITAYYDVPYIPVLLAVSVVLRRITEVLQSDYSRLQTSYSSPDRAATRAQGIRGYMAAGHHGNTGIGGRGRREGRTAHNVNELAAHRAKGVKSERAVSCFPGEEHGHRGTQQTPDGT